jgi:hypothetical protein
MKTAYIGRRIIKMLGYQDSLLAQTGGQNRWHNNSDSPMFVIAW